MNRTAHTCKANQRCRRKVPTRHERSHPTAVFGQTNCASNDQRDSLSLPCTSHSRVVLTTQKDKKYNGKELTKKTSSCDGNDNYKRHTRRTHRSSMRLRTAVVPNTTKPPRRPPRLLTSSWQPPPQRQQTRQETASNNTTNAPTDGIAQIVRASWPQERCNARYRHIASASSTVNVDGPTTHSYTHPEGRPTPKRRESERVWSSRTSNYSEKEVCNAAPHRCTQTLHTLLITPKMTRLTFNVLRKTTATFTIILEIE